MLLIIRARNESSAGANEAGIVDSFVGLHLSFGWLGEISSNTSVQTGPTSHQSSGSVAMIITATEPRQDGGAGKLAI